MTDLDPLPDGHGTTDHRSRPRRRGERLLGPVFDAVLVELSERGYANLTVDAVASRARVSKASLYRRWPGKRDLVLAAVQNLLPDPSHPADTGSLRGDLLAYFRDVADHLGGPAGPALRGILGDVLGNPSSAAELFSSVHRGRSAAQLRLITQRAVARGELPQESTSRLTERQLEAGPAILRHHYLWEGHLSDRLCHEIVDEVVLPLLHQPAADSPPGRDS